MDGSQNAEMIVNDEGRHTKQARIGDFAYADDTAIVGVADEIVHAEPIFG